MTNAELIACIQAEERGEVVECRSVFKSEDEWKPHHRGMWDTTMLEYRIAPKPRRCWVKWDERGTAEVYPFAEEQNADAWKRNGWQLVEEAR